MSSNPHSFHIPVMGLAYTIDTPVKVARYGINSVISIIEDNLIELMRKHYYQESGKEYIPISPKEEDYRARRITDYLNLVNEIVSRQMEKLRASAFEAGSDIIKYFEMLPDNHIAKQAYSRMANCFDENEKRTLLNYLKGEIRAGSIDVNIMTKVDKNNPDKSGAIPPDSSDAVAALRGYVNSTLKNSSVIFSAGMNPRLFNYLEKTSAFDAKALNTFDKKIVIKVSDYRSALIQGKYLAKKGLWVSEFRIESGLNCGGHAFAGEGSLLGPILHEFKTRKDELTQELFRLYTASLTAKGKSTFAEPHDIKLTVQGGIGTFEEANFIQRFYGVESVGWGTPFLLCPEATTVDDHTLTLLCNAKEKDVELSKNSPLNVRFNYLKGTSSETEKLSRIAKGKPGSPCTEKFLVTNTEFTKEPICTASSRYQKHKIAQLRASGLTPQELDIRIDEVTSKECLCIGLSNAAIENYQLPHIRNLKAVTICPGPNIAYFDKIVSLKQMVDHIYGRAAGLSRKDRPHVFIKELMLTLDFIKEKVSESDADQSKEIQMFRKNFQDGIQYYRAIAGNLFSDDNVRMDFLRKLDELESEFTNVTE